MNNNLKSLIKIANAFDLYDHQHYAYRHNRNNPVRKPIELLVARKDNDQVSKIEFKPTQIVPGLPRWPVNKNAPKWSKEQTHIFKRKKSVNGTGGGPPYGVEKKNPYANP